MHMNRIALLLYVGLTMSVSLKAVDIFADSCSWHNDHYALEHCISDARVLEMREFARYNKMLAFVESPKTQRIIPEIFNKYSMPIHGRFPLYHLVRRLDVSIVSLQSMAAKLSACSVDDVRNKQIITERSRLLESMPALIKRLCGVKVILMATPEYREEFSTIKNG